MFLNAIDSTQNGIGGAIGVINAIGNSWQLVLVILSFLSLLIFRNRIGKFISGFNKLTGKVSSVEVNIEKGATNIDIEKNVESSKQILELATPAENEVEKTKEVGWGTVYSCLIEFDWDGAKTAYDALLTEQPDEKSRESLTMFYVAHKYLKGGVSSLEEIEKIAATSSYKESKRNAYEYLGFVYYCLTRYDLSKINYELALDFTSTDEEKGMLYREIADCILKTTGVNSAIEYLVEKLKEMQNGLVKSHIYNKISKFYSDEKKIFEMSIALEMAIKYNPNSTSLMFDAAYNYAQNDYNFKSLSLYYYSKSLAINEKNGAVLNNIGVLYENLQLSGFAIEYYRRASQEQNTLASANLANSYIKSGMYEDAQKILDVAKELPNVHANIWENLHLLNDKREDDKKQRLHLLENAERNQRFISEYSEIFFKLYGKKSDIILKKWKIDNKEVEIVSGEVGNTMKIVTDNGNYSIFIPLNPGCAFPAVGRRTSGLPQDYVVRVFVNDNINQINMLLYDKDDTSSIVIVLVEHKEDSTV